MSTESKQQELEEMRVALRTRFPGRTTSVSLALWSNPDGNPYARAMISIHHANQRGLQQQVYGNSLAEAWSRISEEADNAECAHCGGTGHVTP